MAEKQQRHVRFVMTADEMKVLDSVARMRGFRTRAAYIRELIEQDARDAGVELEFSTTWGGWRGGPSAGRDEE